VQTSRIECRVMVQGFLCVRRGWLLTVLCGAMDMRAVSREGSDVRFESG